MVDMKALSNAHTLRDLKESHNVSLTSSVNSEKQKCQVGVSSDYVLNPIEKHCWFVFRVTYNQLNKVIDFIRIIERNLADKSGPKQSPPPPNRSQGITLRHIPQNCQFILFQSKCFTLHSSRSPDLFEKSMQYLSGCSMVTICKKTNDLIVIDLFGNILSVGHLS